MMLTRTLFAVSLAATSVAQAADSPPAYNDPAPKKYDITARASEIDSRAKEHPEIDFVFNKGGKPADIEHGVVDTRVAPQGKLVIWLMGYNGQLFDRLSGYGLHGIQVHYANGWFGKLNKEPPPDDKYLGRIRLEAATGDDVSDAIDVPKPDGMMERAYQLVKHLSKEHPQGKWEQFIADDGKGIRWDKVIVSGSSHGSTTSARFALHQKVDRVVMLSGPRDQLERWYELPSATDKNRFFAFTHVLDSGWSGDHYCRSWQLLGLNKYGPVVNVDKTPAPFGNSRRLITDAEIKADDKPKAAHGASTPGGSAIKGPDGKYIHEDVWKYLFLHPVDQVGKPVPFDKDCMMDLAKPAKKK